MGGGVTSYCIPAFTQKVVNFAPEWVAGFNRIGWYTFTGMGGRFAPKSTRGQDVSSIMVLPRTREKAFRSSRLLRDKCSIGTNSSKEKNRIREVLWL